MEINFSTFPDCSITPGEFVHHNQVFQKVGKALLRLDYYRDQFWAVGVQGKCQ
jgi:hypothetical protein